MEVTILTSVPGDLIEKKGKTQINNNMTICNGSIEDERMVSTEKESTNIEENREAKQLAC